MMTILIRTASVQGNQSGSDPKTVEQIDTKLSGNEKASKKSKAKLRYIKQNFEKIFANMKNKKLF